MKKMKIWLIIVGLLLISIPYFIPYYSIFKLISVLLGIIIFCIGTILNSHKKLLKIILIPLILMCACFGLDFLNVKYLKNIPIIAIKKKSSAKVISYNGLFYRVYSCNKKLTLDMQYQKSYLCANKDIKKESVNTFLANPEETYAKKKGYFVHIEGKISSIVGNSSLVLNEYEEKYEKNGYVSFNDNKKLVVDGLDIDPANFYIYDYIDVIGLVDSIVIGDEVKEIHLKDAKIIPSSIYDEYEVIVKENYKNDTVLIDNNIYFKGIDSIQYKYDERDYYELSYLLTDKRETFENLVKDTKPEKDEDENADIYKLDDFSVVKCSDDNLIFVRKSITDFEDICKIKEHEND